MRRILLLITALLLAAPALAGTSPPGVNLRWDDCFGDGGAWNKTFACNTNAGVESLIGSFELDAPSLQTSGLEIAIDLRSASLPLPAWWAFKNLGSCRLNSLNVSSLLPLSATNCVDWANGVASIGIGAYDFGLQGPNHARIAMASAVSAASVADLDPGVEYFAFRMTINHAKTVGAGNCAGCDVPVCIFISRIRVFHATGPVGDLSLDQGANYSGSQYATWKNGYPTDIHRVCQFASENCLLFYTTFSCVPYDVTPARNSTWGALKSLYR